MTIFDGWYFPQTCKNCAQAGNGSKKEPISFLDVQTKYCELCFEAVFDEEEVE